MSNSSKDAMDPIEQNRSDGDPPSSSSDTGTSLESSSDSSSSSSSSSSESDTSTAESRSMTKEKLVKRIMKQLSISGSFSAESESSQDDKSRGAESKASKASSKKTAKMIDSILDDISLADSGSSKAESRKETEEMEETEMEETEAEETEMEETEMEEAEAEETNVEETEVEETVEEEEDVTDEDDTEEKDVADGIEEVADISPPIKGVLSDDTDPRVMRPPPIARRTKVIDEELETAAKVKRGETPKPPPPNSSPYYSYFPTFDNLFGCSVNKQLAATVDTPVTEDTKLNKAPSKESIKESEAIPEMSARRKSTDGSKRNHHAPIVIDEEDRITTTGSTSQPLVDPSTLVSGRDSALLDMELNPVFAAVLPAASSGAISSKSQTKGRKLVTTHSMPLEMNMSADSGHAEKDMLRTIRSDDVMDAVTAEKTRSAAKRRVFKKGWSFSSTTKKKADDASKVQTTSTLTLSDEPAKDTTANESVAVVDSATPDLKGPDHQTAPKTNDGELSSESDTTEDDDTIMESTFGQLSEAVDNISGDTQVDSGRKVETQPAVRLSKKLKHWAVKKRGKQDNKNVEPASLEPAALASMYGVRPQARKPKRRKKKKTNLFRSIANYVRNQAPTLPVISEDPDHPDHHDHDHNDDSFAALSAEAKVPEAMSLTSEQVVGSRSSHTGNDNMKDTSDNPVKREEGMVVSPQASFEPKEGIIVARSNSNSQRPGDNRDDHCLSQKSIGRMVSKSRSTATADDANAEDTALLHQQRTPSPESNKTFDSDQRSSIAATISAEVLSAKSFDTKSGEEAVNAMVGSSDDDDMESEMGLELTLSMPGGNVEETTNGAHALSVDIATLNSNGSSSSDKEGPDEKASSPHKGEKKNQAFKNFFRLSISKPRSKKHIGEDEDGSQARSKTESREDNQPAASPQKPLDRKPTWTELRSMSSISASSPAGMKSLSSEDGAEDQKRRNSKTATKRTSKVTNKAMRKVLNLGSRKNEESRETTTSDRDYENHRAPPPEAEDMVEADLSDPIALRRWKSVELKIDESLKKVEALAANYGEDINALLLSESTSYGGDSSIGGGSSVGQSESSEWRDVEKKIDHSLSVVQRLASRLGVNASE